MGKDLEVLFEFSEATLQNKALAIPLLHEATVLVVQILQEDLKKDHGQGRIPSGAIPEKQQHNHLYTHIT